MLKSIAERNAQFLSMDPAGKRVIIAQDVIEQVMLDRVCPQAGRLIHAFTDYAGEERCRACAIGAIAFSLFRTNEIRWGWGEPLPIIREMLSEYFEPTQLALIEGAFEAWDTVDTLELYRSQGIDVDPHRLVSFVLIDSSDDRERLLAIMQNIVRNGGEFIADQFMEERE